MLEEPTLGGSTLPVGDCDFHVTAFVDAQNGFGAKVRSAYDVTVTYLPGTKEWQLKQISIE